MVENPNGPFKHNKNEENNMEIEEEMEEDEDEEFPESEEFQAIDNQLDMLNSVLDTLEQKNDNILAELSSLLKENKEIRQQLQQCQTEEEQNGETDK